MKIIRKMSKLMGLTAIVAAAGSCDKEKNSGEGDYSYEDDNSGYADNQQNNGDNYSENSDSNSGYGGVNGEDNSIPERSCYGEECLNEDNNPFEVVTDPDPADLVDRSDPYKAMEASNCPIHDCISNPGYETTTTWSIGVQPYIITLGGVPAVDESRITEDIENLNDYFQPMNLHFIRQDDSQTKYVESGIWWDIDIFSTEFNDLLANITYSQGHWPMVYVNTMGYGQFDGAALQCNHQGIVLAARNKYGKVSSPGQTAAHEFGHQFCLYHTHEGGCGMEECDGSNCHEAGDFVCDTPRDNPTPWTSNICSYDDYFASCEVNCTSCDPDTSNIMSYYGPCRDNFTLEQRRIMVCYLDSW